MGELLKYAVAATGGIATAFVTLVSMYRVGWIDHDPAPVFCELFQATRGLFHW